MTSTKKVKEVYQKGFAKTEYLNHDARLQKVIKLAKYHLYNSVDKLLDLGCGDGFFTKQLGEAVSAKKLYGVDISQAAVKLAIKNKVTAITLDIDEKKLPYPDNFFDLVYCGNIIELVADADHLLIEVKRTLKKGGLAIFTFPNLSSWLSRLAVLLGYFPFYYRVSTNYDLGKMFGQIKKGKSTGFIRLFTVSSFEELIKLYGLRVRKNYGVNEKALPRPLQIVDEIISTQPSLAFKIVSVVSN